MRNNLGRQGSRRQDLGLVRDIDRSRLPFLLCVIRVPAGPLRVDAGGRPDVSRRPIALIKINNGDKINNDTCDGLTPALLTA
jgi:hypothetical protein